MIEVRVPSSVNIQWRTVTKTSPPFATECGYWCGQCHLYRRVYGPNIAIAVSLSALLNSSTRATCRCAAIACYAFRGQIPGSMFSGFSFRLRIHRLGKFKCHYTLIWRFGAESIWRSCSRDDRVLWKQEVHYFIHRSLALNHIAEVLNPFFVIQ